MGEETDETKAVIQEMFDIEERHYDIVVCGAGLAGIAAAISAARCGATVCLIGDRPVLGGNSSSEIRVEPRGAACYHAYGRETGVISEILVEDRMHNHAEVFENGWANSMWDLQLYDLVQRTAGLELLLNTSIIGVERLGRNIVSVEGLTLGAEKVVRLTAGTFIDATGDGVVATLAGCEFRIGSESFVEFQEPHAADEASSDVMGSSIQLKTRDMGRPVPFVAPDWAHSYDDASFFTKGGRMPWDVRGGWWWLEIGVPWDTVHDNELIRHELTRHALGVWDWVKNKSPEFKERFQNYALEWLGQVPGKRESRRVLGQYLMTEHDLAPDEPLTDQVAYGGWNIDLHTPGGLLAETSEPTAAEGYVLGGSASTKAYVSPFGIPLRSLVAKDVDNLLLAGRDISVTHVALGSVRVMGTTAIVGQAAGTAAGLAYSEGIEARNIHPILTDRIQQRLLRDGAFLPDIANSDEADLARQAAISASSERENDGIRPGEMGAESGYLIPASGRESVAVADLVDRTRGQWIAVETGEGARGIERVGMLLSNTSTEVITIHVRIQAVTGIWDYDRRTDDVVREGTVSIAPGERQWVHWKVEISPNELPVGHQSVGYLRLEIDAAPKVTWHRADSVLPGCVSAVAMDDTRLRRFEDGVSLCHTIQPAQRVWTANQLKTGMTRPNFSTGQWISNPDQSMPQFIELVWDRPRLIGVVELTFCGHILREFDRYPPAQPDPEVIKNYRIDVWDGHWNTAVEVRDNYQTRRSHRLDPSTTATRLRLVVEATNGADYASLYEIRCYEGEQDC